MKPFLFFYSFSQEYQRKMVLPMHIGCANDAWTVSREVVSLRSQRTQWSRQTSGKFAVAEISLNPRPRTRRNCLTM